MRSAHWQSAGEDVFDVLIIGGGITGASLYGELCRHGWRTLLLDKGDFASGTSQSSGMMVWGGEKMETHLRRSVDIIGWIVVVIVILLYFIFTR